jgi:hypothetical protein
MASSKLNFSEKHLIIDKANRKMVITISIAVFVVVFSAFAIRALLSQSLYHGRVITEKKLALSTLKENNKAAVELEQSYVSFVTEPINIIGGNPTGTGPRDGDNAKLVLDSLPSIYDYPALSSSIEKILLDGGFQIESVGGQEDANLQQDSSSGTITTSEPTPVEIPYPFSVQTDVSSAVRLLQILESSIRPFSINSLSLTGQQNSIEVDIDLNTYYQPASGLVITKKEVK